MIGDFAGEWAELEIHFTIQGLRDFDHGVEGVDLLLVLGGAMFAGVIEELYELGEFVGMEFARCFQEVFRWPIGAVCQKVDSAGRSGLVEDGFHEEHLT